MTSFFAASLMLSRWKLLIMPSVSSNWCSRRAIISWRYLSFLTISAWVFLTASSLVGSTLLFNFLITLLVSLRVVLNSFLIALCLFPYLLRSSSVVNVER